MLKTGLKLFLEEKFAKGRPELDNLLPKGPMFRGHKAPFFMVSKRRMKSSEVR